MYNITCLQGSVRVQSHACATVKAWVLPASLMFSLQLTYVSSESHPRPACKCILVQLASAHLHTVCINSFVNCHKQVRFSPAQRQGCRDEVIQLILQVLLDRTYCLALASTYGEAWHQKYVNMFKTSKRVTWALAGQELLSNVPQGPCPVVWRHDTLEVHNFCRFQEVTKAVALPGCVMCMVSLQHIAPVQSQSQHGIQLCITHKPLTIARANLFSRTSCSSALSVANSSQAMHYCLATLHNQDAKPNRKFVS